MKLSDLLPGQDILKSLQGVEHDLLLRRRRGTRASLALLVAGALQVALVAPEKTVNAIGALANAVVRWDFSALQIDPAALLGTATLAAALAVFVLARHSALLLRESREPFRYTFSVEPFKLVEGTPAATRASLQADDRLRLLHLDLIERLATRVSRLSLRESAAADATPRAVASSHVRVRGELALREDERGRWLLYVLPRVRIGGDDSADTLDYAIRFPLTGRVEGNVVSFDAKQYLQFVERVYSNVATIIYRRIKDDLEQKLRLFPTRYRRAIARFHEARDLARSNTIDAFDQALALFEAAEAEFESAWTTRAAHYAFRCDWPLAWYVGAYHARARLLTGYARASIARHVTATLSGRQTGPIFRLCAQLAQLVDDLERLNERIAARREGPLTYRHLLAFLSAPRAPRAISAAQRELLFEAYAVRALLLAELGGVDKPPELLEIARAIAPDLVDSNFSFLWAQAEVERGVEARINRFRQMTERHPQSQIAQFRLAFWQDMRLRSLNELTPARAEAVVREYERALAINPGNVAALAALGYLHWLLDQPEQARDRFLQGLELKELVRETYVGELNYGLARIAAESSSDPANAASDERDFVASFEYFELGIAAEPALAAQWQSSRRMPTAYFEFIGVAMLRRYWCLYGRVRQRASRLKAAAGSVPEALVPSVLSHVANDVANAFFRYYVRTGDPRAASVAGRLYAQALRSNRRNAVARFNRFVHGRWAGSAAPATDLRDIAEAMPRWQIARIEQLRETARVQQSRLHAAREQMRNAQSEVERLRAELRTLALRAAAGALGERTARPDAGDTRRAASVEADLARAQDALHAATEGRESAESEWRAIRTSLIAELLKSSALAPLASGDPGDIDTRRMAVLLNDRRLEWENLDRTDIDLLRVWAELMVPSSDVELLALAEAICATLLSRFAPDDFDVLMTQRRLLQAQQDVAGAAAQNEAKLRAVDRLVQQQVEFWLAHDPTHYDALNWLFDSAPAAQQIAALRRARNAESFTPSALWGLADASWRAAARHDRPVLALLRHAAADDSIDWRGLRDGLRLRHAALKFVPQRWRARLEDELADIYRRIGAYRLRTNRPEHAWRQYNRALNLRPNDPHSWLERAAAAQRRGTGATRLSYLEAAAGDVERALELQRHAGDDPRMFAAAGERLARLHRKLAFGRACGDAALDWIWLTTPIVVEIGSALIPYFESAGGALPPETSERVVAMREHVFKRFGARIPGVRFRGVEGELPPLGFVVRIEEAIQASGDLAAQKPAGDPLGLLLDAIEAAVTARLSHFVGHQEAMNLVYELAYEHVDEFERDGDALGRLVDLLRQLLDDRVPIVALKPLAALVLDQPEAAFAQLVREARTLAGVREALPGTGTDDARIALPADCEATVRAHLHGSGDERALLLAPNDSVRLARRIEEAIDGHERPALVVADGDLRFAVSAFAHLALAGTPHATLPVLARDELAPEQQRALDRGPPR